MPEAQLAVTGYNIAGLDPIEVAHSSAGTTLDLSADTTAYGKMHVMSGSANYTCILPTAVGHEGETIGFRGSSALTSAITLDPTGTETIDGFSTVRLISNESRVLRATSGNWATVVSNPFPFGRGALSASLGSNQTVSSGAPTKMNCNTIVSPTNKLDGGGWYNTSTATYSPTLSGYFLFMVSFSTPAATAANQFAQAKLYKNGTEKMGGSLIVVPNGYGMTAQVLNIDYATPSDSYQPWAYTLHTTVNAGSGFQVIYLGGS